MTWLIVVGVVVAVALAVHFGEERKSRAAIQARKARAAKPGRISHTRRVNETWEIDLEAMVAVAVAALTVYDMVKGAERGVEIRGVRLEEKTGGKSGLWLRRSGSKPVAKGRASK